MATASGHDLFIVYTNINASVAVRRSTTFNLSYNSRPKSELICVESALLNALRVVHLLFLGVKEITTGNGLSWWWWWYYGVPIVLFITFIAVVFTALRVIFRVSLWRGVFESF